VAAGGGRKEEIPAEFYACNPAQSRKMNSMTILLVSRTNFTSTPLFTDELLAIRKLTRLSRFKTL